MSANTLPLRDWTNAKKMGTRFPPSEFRCPDCNGKLLQDNWPPNYGGGGGGGGGADGQWFYWSNSSVKCVCLACHTAVRVSIATSSNAPSRIEYSERVPLVQGDDGIWLTPHDVWREKWKAENGEYPSESYG